VLQELIQEQVLQASEVRVRFYGPVEPWLPMLVARYGLGDVVRLNGVLPRREVLQREMESQILLLLGWSDSSETGQHTGKLFEYLGAARPILAVGGYQGVLTDVLHQTNAGIHALSRSQLRECLATMYREFRETGEVGYQADPVEVNRYGHPEMARKFAQLLDEIAGTAAATRSIGEFPLGHWNSE
jgi:hypothetical protein